MVRHFKFTFSQHNVTRHKILTERWKKKKKKKKKKHNHVVKFK